MAALKKALADAEDKAAKERASRERHEARVGEAQQELQSVIERFESLERNYKAQESKIGQGPPESAGCMSRRPKRPPGNSGGQEDYGG